MTSHEEMKNKKARNHGEGKKTITQTAKLFQFTETE